MGEKNATDFNSALGELLRHSNGMAFAQRNLRVFRYLIWQLELRQWLANNSEKTEAIAVAQAIDAVDECLKLLLQESKSESEFTLCFQKMLEEIRCSL